MRLHRKQIEILHFRTVARGVTTVFSLTRPTMASLMTADFIEDIFTRAHDLGIGVGHTCKYMYTHLMSQRHPADESTSPTR